MEKHVYQGHFIRVTEETLNGQVYERAHINDAITIFPFDEKGRLIIIKEKRIHETPSVRWKPVTGFYEDDVSYEENVNRELQEEIGLKAREVRPYFKIVQTGTINITHYFALALGLSPSKIPNPDGEDTILAIEALEIEEVLARTLAGELVRGTGGYALLKLCLEIGKGLVELNPKN